MFNTAKQIFGPRVLLRAVFPVLCSLAIVWMLFDRLSQFDIASARQSVAGFGPQTWGLGLAFSFISFLAVSRYDPIAAKILKLNIPTRRARSIGWKATAMSQLVGFGLITGTIVRWLELSYDPDKGRSNTAAKAFKMTAMVSVCFLFGWVIIAIGTGSLLLLPVWPAIAIVTCALIFTLRIDRTVTRWLPGLAVERAHTGNLVMLTFVDTLFAALAIYVFFPADLAPFSAVYLAFLLSYTVGLISGLPGGMGPFEICMLALLPGIDPVLLAPALIGFRAVYFAIPATCAVLCLGRDLLARDLHAVPVEIQTKIPKSLRNAAPPEKDLVEENHFNYLVSCDQSEAAIVMTTPRCIVQLGDTFGRRLSSCAVTRAFMCRARWVKKAPAIYRCDKTTALQAKSMGMKALRFSSEALVKPAQFDLNIPERATLRRKLRKAAKKGVKINSRLCADHALIDIDRDWTKAHGTTRGFSTGTFSLDLIRRQRIYVAYLDDAPIGFVTFSLGRGVWQLDLIRYRADCPDGTVYALVERAIEDAKLANIDHLSLGSVPLAPPCHGKGVSGLIQKQIFAHSKSLKGLYQFKKCFAPTWQDRFFVFDTWLGGTLTSLSIFAAIFGFRTSTNSERGS